MKRQPITYTQAVMADLEIRQGARRGDVASRLVPDVGVQRARAVLKQALVQHGVYQHNPAANSRARGQA